MRSETDILVVGSGSAGAVLAGRLAGAGARVMLLEAGPSDRHPFYRVPLMTGRLLRSPRNNWAYRTEPEPGLNGRQLYWPRGKVLGGSSAINGMVWTRGFPADYQGWAASGLPDWSWERVLASYRSIEAHWAGESAYHGGYGEQILSRIDELHPLSEAFLVAARAAGLPSTDDFNGASPEGAGRYDFTIAKGRRLSAARAFLSPQLRQPGLQIRTGVQVLRVLIEGGRAIGVEALVEGHLERIHAAREVVLCAGTVNSPQLLMLSGIGPAEHLRSLGLPVILDRPEVGRNLHDHLLVRVEHDCTEPVTLARLLRADRAAIALLQAILSGSGPAARFPLEVGAFIRSDPALGRPDLQVHFLPGRSTAVLRAPWQRATIEQSHGFFANVCVMRPASRGEIRLRSADPLAAPTILGRYLTEPEDLSLLRIGVRHLRDIFRQSAFDRWRGAECAPGAARQSDAEIDAWIRASADTVFHPVGSCRMGSDPESVVDGRLRVRGVDGLRVADASVMPMIASCNTQAPTMMIGAQAAGFILNESPR
jgi:choline dehydrogenase